MLSLAQFHPPQSQPDRPLEPSAWSGWVKRMFKRHHGEEIAPKTLRSVRIRLRRRSGCAALLTHDVWNALAQVFITWLRDSTSAPDVLKSAAHAMKHSVQRQASPDCKLWPLTHPTRAGLARSHC